MYFALHNNDILLKVNPVHVGPKGKQNVCKFSGRQEQECDSPIARGRDAS